ncbi:G2/mitotic-specific cyclin-B3 [Octodon degus]|uniref:G2/mitotic-specific cyclin-B3 n=1 Tax=Octodon degus TaxID=10160 RepID=A0A6P3FIC0_OCTDE|nr:G2/mitotic-specific cyclin-B3 [Octodon degus]
MPLPTQNSKPESKKLHSTKIVPSDHGQLEKMGDDYQENICPSSPQENFKKRSAFEDITNAFQSQTAQSKKEANKDTVKDVPKIINKRKYNLELDKCTEMSQKRYRLHLVPVVTSTPSAPDILEKPFLPDVSSNSQTPIVAEISSVKRPIILKGEPSMEEKTIIKKSLKKCSNPEEASLLEKSPSLQEESDDDDFITEPVTFQRKHNPKERVINKKTSLNKMYTYQGKQSFSEELVTSQDSDVEEGSFSMDLMNLRKKPKTEESSSSKNQLPLNSKHTTVEKISNMKKPVILQKITSEEELVTKEPSVLMKKSTASEESLSWEPFALKEKHTTKQENPVLRKSLPLQEKTDLEDDFLFKELLISKQKLVTKESTLTKSPVFGKQKCVFQGKINPSHGRKYNMCEITSQLKKPLDVQEDISQKSLNAKPLSFKRDPITEFCQEPSSSQEKHSSEEEVSILKKPVALQKSPTEKQSLFQESLPLQKQYNTEKVTLSKKHLPLKEKQHATQEIVSHLKKPLVLQTVTSETKSPIKKPLSSKEENTSLKVKKCTTETMLRWIDLSDWQDILDKEKNSSLKKRVLFKKKCTTKKAVPTKTPSSLKKKETTHGKTTSEEQSLGKKLSPIEKKTSTKEVFLFQEQSALKEKHTALQEVSLSREPVPLQEKTTTKEESCSKEQVTLEEQDVPDEFFYSPELFSPEEPTDDSEPHFQKTEVLQEETYSKKDSLKKALVFHEKSTKTEESCLGEPSVLREKPSDKKATITERQLPMKNMPTAQGQALLSKEQLALHENITDNERFLIEDPLKFVCNKKPLFRNTLAIQKKLSTQKEDVRKEHTIDIEAYFEKLVTIQKKLGIEKEPIFQECLNLQKNPTIEEGTIFTEPLALQEKAGLKSEAILKEPLALQEKHSPKMKAVLEEPLALEEKPSSEEEAIHNEPLAFQEKSDLDDKVISEEPLALDEKSTTGNELSFQEPLILEENPTEKEDLFPEAFLILEDSARVSSNDVESKTSKFNAANMSSVGESSTSELGSQMAFLLGRTQEMTTLEDIDKYHRDSSFNPAYAKDVFSYLKDREEKFILQKYMERQTEITSDMRAILVDWMVEVQMSFSMSHETLYLAVKLVDHYLMKALCKKDKLQLLGSTAYLIAAKFEEIIPPGVNEFLYICEDMYQRQEMLGMEINILKTLNFDINIPIAYHFLRRYALCLSVSMKTLTLSRFICEMTLQKYDYVHVRASKLAAASFLLALYMKKLKNHAPLLEYCSGYTTFELHPLVRQLSILLTFHQYDKLKTVYNKYSQETFFEVAKIPPLEMALLDEILTG